MPDDENFITECTETDNLDRLKRALNSAQFRQKNLRPAPNREKSLHPRGLRSPKPELAQNQGEACGDKMNASMQGNLSHRGASGNPILINLT